MVDNYVREKLFSLRQQQEDMAVLISQVNSVFLECEKSLQRTDAEVSAKTYLAPTSPKKQELLIMGQVLLTVIYRNIHVI